MRSIYRIHLKNSIRTFSACFSTRLLLDCSSTSRVAPFWHCVSDENPDHIAHLYPVKSLKDFKSELEFLLKHFEPVDYLDYVKPAIKSKPRMLLSFDDGLSECYNLIAPILESKGIPAVFFLNSAFIDNKNLFYRYQASAMIAWIEQKFLQKDQNAAKLIPQSLGADFKSTLLSIKYAQQDHLHKLATDIDFDADAYLNRIKPYMTSEQLQDLLSRGFHLGAHSVDHPLYADIHLKQQIAQTKNSLDYVQEKFDVDYRIFAFPFTDHAVTKAFFEKTRADQIMDYSFGTAGIKEDCVPKNFQRIAFENNNIHGKAILKTELLYTLMKQALGKNKIQRS